MISWLVCVDVFSPALAEQTDFLNSCYVAGKICATNSYDVLYPPLEASSQARTKFAETAHELMPLLPKNSSPVWQYPPIDAQFFSLFVGISPSLALMAWQILGLISIGISAYAFAKSAEIDWFNSISLLILFFPFFFTLKTGQQGIIFGVLPISLSLYFFSKQKPVLAGLAGGVTFFTMKYLLLFSFICAGLASLNLGVLFGLIASCLFICGFTLLTTPFATVVCWIHNLQLSEAYFFDPHLAHKLALYTSLPPLLILSSPIEYRYLAKVLVYSISSIVALLGLFFIWMIAKSPLPLKSRVCFIFASAIYLMPIVQPHLLYYDLSLIMPANILLWSRSISEPIQSKLRVLTVLLALLINGYFISFAVFNSPIFNPLVFNLLLVTIIVQILFGMKLALRESSIS